jgi:sigma-54 specific flagellar transcriptional regulator A
MLNERMKDESECTVELTSEAMASIMQHPWPGNIRELSNFIERLAITNPNSTIDASDLPEKFLQYEVPGDMDLETIELADAIAVVDQQPTANGTPVISPIVSQLPEQGMDLKEYLNNMEVDLIQQALNECNGVVAHAAKLLNMRRTTLVEKLRKYELSS